MTVTATSPPSSPPPTPPPSTLALSSSTLARVPHIQQSTVDDCGLAAVAMVLYAILGEQSPTPADLARIHGNSDSIWTVDLAYLLRFYHAPDFTYYTSYIGISPTFTHQPFYNTPSFDADRERVHGRFAQAHDSGIRILPHRLTLHELGRFLLTDTYAIILLCDLCLLKCRHCLQRRRRSIWFTHHPQPPSSSKTPVSNAPNLALIQTTSIMSHSSLDRLTDTTKVPAFPPKTKYWADSTAGRWVSHTWKSFRSQMSSIYRFCTPCIPHSLPNSAKSEIYCNSDNPLYESMGHQLFTHSDLSLHQNPEFLGHYIVLVEYDLDRDIFWYRDPGIPDPLCCISGKDLNRSRLSLGTDDDAIVVRTLPRRD